MTAETGGAVAAGSHTAQRGLRHLQTGGVKQTASGKAGKSTDMLAALGMSQPIGTALTGTVLTEAVQTGTDTTAERGGMPTETTPRSGGTDQSDTAATGKKNKIGID